MLRWLAVVTLVAVVAVPAAAQEPGQAPGPEVATERARQLFREGIDLADSGDWERAVHRFRRALELRDAAPVRYNLAMSLGHMGRGIEAIEELDRVLADPALEAQARESAIALRAELTARLGRLTVEVRGDVGDSRVTVDGRAWGELGVPAPADPGIRIVRLLSGTEELDVEEADVPEGGATSVFLEVPAPPVSEGSDDAWIWGIVIGVVLVVAGAAVVTGVVLSEMDGSPGMMMSPLRLEW